MGNTTRLAAIALLGLAACGSGGGGGGNSGSGGNAGSAFGVVNLVAHSPADQAVQVPVDVVLQLEFDANMAMETFAYPDTWLRETETQIAVPVTFTPGSNGRVAVQPDQLLKNETDYTFQLAALTTDQSGRILDTTATFTFRTFDETPPTLTGFDVANNASNVSRTGQFTLSFDEVIAQASITDQTLYLRDVFGGRYPCASTVVDQTVVMDPYADLPGNRQFFVIATTALEDRAGNRLQAQFQSTFTTADDADAPSVATAWPALNATGISPLVQPTFTFDESMDPATVEAASLLFQDEFGSIVPFAIEATRDQRTLRVRPTVTLQQNRGYTLAFLLGGAAATDVSGNQLSATQALTFTTGTDQTAPVVVASSPAAGETRVPGVLVAEVQFDEDLDEDWIDTETVQLLVDGQVWASVVERVSTDTVRVTPVLTLPTDTECTLRLRGGQDGLHDLAGNVPGADVTIAFTTSADGELPDAILLPPDGAVSIAVGSDLTVVFDAPMDPATLNTSTILFTDDFGNPLAGDLTVDGSDRVVTFSPATNLASNAYYRMRVVGGNSGPRRKTGNWFDSDRLSRFRTSSLVDGIAPSVTASINGIPESRRSGLVLPPYGWTIDISTSDAQSQWVDMGSVQVEFTGGLGPDAETLMAVADVGYNTVSVEVPESAALSAGSWTMTVRARDLSGNVGQSNVIAFEVDNQSGGALPFERTQVVWVRTDLDRDSNGRPDFADDMLRLGFATDGDPNGSNAWLEAVVLDGILAKANALYKRGQRGEPLDSGSVQLRFSTFEPISLPHMQMALGGLDPEGDRTRTYGDESTGVLGRAYYDYRNGNVAERNTSNSPGTGVFPSEMFLYQARIHQQVYPSFQTVFASKFLPLCPEMGGTPAGSHPLDAAVLRPDFDYDAASGSERARWNTVMAAMDDWAAVIGVILAHEVGHSVGLVAPGAMPNGLFGDSSLHDTFAGAAEVMAPSVGYEAMTSLDYQFRDIDLAYLRQRILLR
jgi:hypothetical protein